SFNVICEKIHEGHKRWRERGGVCVSCLVEIMDMSNVSAVRKRAALMSVTRVLATGKPLFEEEEEEEGIKFLSSLTSNLQHSRIMPKVKR
ncbi:hypothetical protein DNTS_018295, partial [Danionella cerebrum]